MLHHQRAHAHTHRPAARFRFIYQAWARSRSLSPVSPMLHVPPQIILRVKKLLLCNHHIIHHHSASLYFLQLKWTKTEVWGSTAVGPEGGVVAPLHVSLREWSWKILWFILKKAYLYFSIPVDVLNYYTSSCVKFIPLKLYLVYGYFRRRNVNIMY